MLVAAEVLSQNLSFVSASVTDSSTFSMKMFDSSPRTGGKLVAFGSVGGQQCSDGGERLKE